MSNHPSSSPRDTDNDDVEQSCTTPWVNNPAVEAYLPIHHRIDERIGVGPSESWEEFLTERVGHIHETAPQPELESADSHLTREIRPQEVPMEPTRSDSSLSPMLTPELENLQDQMTNHNQEDDNSGAIQSDANTSHRPPSIENAEPVSTEHYNRYLADLRDKWLRNRGDPMQEIDIPDGYLYVQVPRTNSTSVEPPLLDRYLYGHPGHYRFQNVYEFCPHLKFLIAKTNGEDVECECNGCTRKT